VVGDDLNPSDGVEKGGVRVRNLWGEMAYQLGGRDGFMKVASSDGIGMSPDTGFLEELSGGQPLLIMIDEPAVYMRKMPNPGQLPAFMKALSEWVDSSSNTVLVYTLASTATSDGPPDAFAQETQELALAMGEVQSVLARPERVVTPTQPRDIEPILRQRLFESVDTGAAEEVADAYFNALQDAHAKEAPLPVKVLQASYRDELVRTYPFHPSFVEVLNGKLNTIPNFQRTRGALRLVSRIIRGLWNNNRTDGYLIHPFSADLGSADMLDELTGRLDRAAFRSVADADISASGGQAHAQVIDSDRFSGHAPYTQRAATTVFLHSLVEPPARGADVDEVLAATLTPTDDPSHIEKSLQYLADDA
ncbi:MAG TPA: DUF499 domain-containing protein, partial [Gemmatimonadetes bacterium]|nr:DUF499 domain-containing protein [Gemmatimonadota bacterium]